MAIPAETILSDIQRLLSELQAIEIPLEDVAPTRWADLGLHSLDFTELLVYLERAYACTVPNKALVAVVTFGDLAHVIAGCTGKGA